MKLNLAKVVSSAYILSFLTYLVFTSLRTENYGFAVLGIIGVVAFTSMIGSRYIKTKRAS